MQQQNADLLNDCVQAVEQCVSDLEKIAGSCCMPERSVNMETAFAKLKQINTSIKQAYTQEKEIIECVNYIGELGSKIGFLYATCCTAERESLYQKIFKQLGEVHSKLWAVLGHSH